MEGSTSFVQLGGYYRLSFAHGHCLRRNGGCSGFKYKACFLFGFDLFLFFLLQSLLGPLFGRQPSAQPAVCLVAEESVYLLLPDWAGGRGKGGFVWFSADMTRRSYSVNKTREAKCDGRLPDTEEVEGKGENGYAPGL